MPTFPDVPDSIKSVAHYLKIADDHDGRNDVICYYSRMYAIQHAMRLVPGVKPPEVGRFLLAIMEHLEVFKKEHADVEGIINETVAQALIEEYILKLYDYALTEDDNERFHKNMIKAFYTIGVLCDILSQFGDLSEDMHDKQMFSKQRAAYIHNTLRQGNAPMSSKTRVLNAKEAAEDKTFLTKEEMDEEQRKGSDTAEAAQTWTKNFISEFKEDGNDTREEIQPEEPSLFPELPSVPPKTPTLPTPPIMAPPVTPTTPAAQPSPPSFDGAAAAIDAAKMDRAQKYCKWATSALNYEDVSTAITNLEKALHLLKTGTELA